MKGSSFHQGDSWVPEVTAWPSPCCTVCSVKTGQLGVASQGLELSLADSRLWKKPGSAILQGMLSFPGFQNPHHHQPHSAPLKAFQPCTHRGNDSGLEATTGELDFEKHSPEPGQRIPPSPDWIPVQEEGRRLHRPEPPRLGRFQPGLRGTQGRKLRVNPGTPKPVPENADSTREPHQDLSQLLDHLGEHEGSRQNTSKH